MNRELEIWRRLAEAGSHDGLFEWRVGTDEVYYSDRLRAQLGLSSEEFPNTHEAWESRLHPEDRERVLKSVALYRRHLPARVSAPAQGRLLALDFIPGGRAPPSRRPGAIFCRQPYGYHPPQATGTGLG